MYSVLKAFHKVNSEIKRIEINIICFNTGNLLQLLYIMHVMYNALR